MKKFIVASIIGSLVGLYTTFVIQHLWNWFATSALHVSEIPFWVMYGFVLLISLFRDSDGLGDEQRWKSLFTILDACIPDGKKQEVEAQIKQQAEVSVWVDAGLNTVGKLFGTTFVLGLGFAVHMFLT